MTCDENIVKSRHHKSTFEPFKMHCSYSLLKCHLWLNGHRLFDFQGNSMQTNIQLDFGDGTAVSYSNLSWTEEGIKHAYKSAGIFRVTALAENTLGYDTTTLFLHVTCKSDWNYYSETFRSRGFLKVSWSSSSDVKLHVVPTASFLNI